jgi:Ser/Thr protein kinase RdoA (MazF antagonist)
MSAIQMQAFAPADAAKAPGERAVQAVASWLAPLAGRWRIAGVDELQRAGSAGSSGQAVFQFRLAGPAEARSAVVAKCLRPGHAPAAVHAQVALNAALARRDAVLVVPRLLHADGPRSVLVQERARGTCLADFCGRKLLALQGAVERCGRALRELHALPLDVVEAHGHAPAAGPRSVGIPDQLAALLRPQPMTLAARSPQLRERVLQVMQQLLVCEAMCEPVAAVPLHRDVHPRQLFVDGRRITLIDWDLCGAGDPALDLANLLMHLQLRWPDRAPDLQQRLLEGWCSAGPAEEGSAAARAALLQRIHLYRGFHALRRACKAWRLGTAVAADWLDRTAQHLDACRRSGEQPHLPSSPAPRAWSLS